MTGREKPQLVVIPALQSSVNNNGLLWEACWPTAGWTLGCCKYKYMHKYRQKYRYKYRLVQLKLFQEAAKSARFTGIQVRYEWHVCSNNFEHFLSTYVHIIRLHFMANIGTFQNKPLLQPFVQTFATQTLVLKQVHRNYYFLSVLSRLFPLHVLNHTLDGVFI